MEFPPMGDPLPHTTKLDIPESIKGMVLRYADSCGQLIEIPFGLRVEEALLEGARQIYDAVIYEGEWSHGAIPDHVIRVDLVDWSFDLNKEYLYDRAPATIRLNAIVQVSDMKGTVLRKTEIKIARQERLRLEQLAKNCNYIIEPFIQDTVVDFSAKVYLDARVALDGRQLPQAPAARALGSAPPRSVPGSPRALVPAGSSTPSILKFKALLLDENSNLILEGGEHVRIRIDVINTGSTPIQNATATLTGTPSILKQFPAAILPIPALQPGETKSLEFMATLPPAAQPQQAEIHVLVAEAGGSPAAPVQTLSLAIQPTGTGTDSIDRIPLSGSGIQRSDTFLLSIGVGSYRNPKIPPRKYAAADAAMVANYFQSLGGLPASNVRLLQDAKVRRLDIDDALLDWLPYQVTKNSTVIVYFSGQAMVTATGDLLFVPHEGSSTATSLLYPLKELESALARLKVKQTLLIFDGMVSKLPGDAKTSPLAPRWEPGEGSTIRLIGVDGFAKGLLDDQHRHGLFTYYLLRGLRGEADTNRNGSITLGELASYVRQKVAWAAKTRFKSDQRPLILPALKPGDPATSLVLTELPATLGTETP